MAARPSSFILLIVPYGIETSQAAEAGNANLLLIVPYGIETPEKRLYIIPYNPFNCTLWN